MGTPSYTAPQTVCHLSATAREAAEREAMGGEDVVVLLAKPRNSPAPQTQGQYKGKLGYEIMRTYYKGRESERLVRHQIESFDHFMNHQMQATIDMYNSRRVVADKDYNADTGDHNLAITYSVENLKFIPPQLFENTGATKPMFPQEAKLRQFTYAAGTTVDLRVTLTHRYDTDSTGADINALRTTETVFRGIKFIDIPIMVGSSHCIAAQYKKKMHVALDEDGTKDCLAYFISKGSVKAQLSQERAAENRVYVYASNLPKYDFIAEYRSVPDHKCISAKQMEMRLASMSQANIYGRGISVVIPRMKLKATIGLFDLFRVLGITSDKHICNIILLNVDERRQAEMLRFLEASMYEATPVAPEPPRAPHGSTQAPNPTPPTAHQIQVNAFNVFMNVVAYNVYTKPPHKQVVPEELSEDTLTNLITAQGTDILARLADSFRDEIKYTARSKSNEPLATSESATSPEEEAAPQIPITVDSDSEKAVVDPEGEGEGENEWEGWCEEDVALALERLRAKVFEVMRAQATIVAELERYCAQHVHMCQAMTFSLFFLDILRRRKVHATKSNNKKWVYALGIINNELFPHCRTQDQKVFTLGLVANRLIQTALGWIETSDRDAYTNKRIDTAGTLFNNLFRNLYGRFLKVLDKNITKEIERGSWSDPTQIIHVGNIHKLFTSKSVESGILRAVATGDFSVKQTGGASKVGVIQLLDNLNYQASISHLRRINTPLDKTGEIIAPRQIHGTALGFLCPVETPEGHSVGGVKQLAIMSHITILSNSAIVYSVVAPYIDALRTGVAAIDGATEYTHILASDPPADVSAPTALYDRVKLFINGNWVGVARDPLKCYADLKAMKHNGTLNAYTSISFNYPRMEIWVCTDGGRLIRPLIRYQNARSTLTPIHEARIRANQPGQERLSWVDMVIGTAELPSCIEYIDADEQAGAMIGLRTAAGNLIHTEDKTHPLYRNYNYTHEEIDACTWLGVLASGIPFSHLNQSPRNAYQCAMRKQAMGATAAIPSMEKTTYSLAYPSQPLVSTAPTEILRMNDMPSGYQVNLAIVAYSGYNQEDSLLVSQGAVDRGLFVTTIFHTEKDDDKNIDSRDEVIRCVPDMATTKGYNRDANYTKLCANGFNNVNQHLSNEDVLIGKKALIKSRKEDTRMVFDDQSKVYHTNEADTYVHRNFLARNGDGNNMAKTQVRVFRSIGIGDKMASDSAQKGTTGLLVPTKDMPFTKDGIPIDIMLNPHAIPSRMTIAQLMSSTLGKVLVHLGMFADGTCFGDITLDVIIGELRRCGYEAYGNEIMYSGYSGKQLEASVFVGPVYYQRLKHMVNDKEHSRNDGHVVMLTRQPRDGRARDGGLRWGEMERDCLISHGIDNVTRDRLFYASDKYAVNVCGKCGMLATVNEGAQSAKYAMPRFTIHECRTCGNMTDFGYVELPYAAKLLFQELQMVNVAPRIMYR